MENDSVIPTGVSSEGNHSTPEVQRSARELAMDEIESRHQQRAASESGHVLPLEGTPAPVSTVPPSGIDEVDAQLADPPVSDPVLLPADPPATPADRQMVTVKIDGVAQEVPLDEVVGQYQKNGSADRRLAEASKLLRDAQVIQAAQLQQDQDAQLLAQTAAPPSTPVVIDDASDKEFLKAMFDGDEENALTALRKLMVGRQPPAVAVPTLDIEQITNAVTQQVQQKLVAENALAQSRRDYPELYADPDMEALALSKIRRMRQDEGVDFFVALDAVGKDMAAKFKWSAHQDEGRPADLAPTISQRAAKLAQKQSIDNVRSINTKTVSTEQQPENPSDVIAAMKAARAGG